MRHLNELKPQTIDGFIKPNLVYFNLLSFNWTYIGTKSHSYLLLPIFNCYSDITLIWEFTFNGHITLHNDVWRSSGIIV